MGRAKPSSVYVAKEKAVGKGQWQRTVAVLMGVIMEHLYHQPVGNPEANSLSCKEGLDASCVGREDLRCSVDGGDVT